MGEISKINMTQTAQTLLAIWNKMLELATTQRGSKEFAVLHKDFIHIYGRASLRDQSEYHQAVNKVPGHS